MVETVNFDVGGKKHRVTKSQIDLHPNTMIAKLVSDQWRQDGENEIFIDRNGTLFEYVLDYLRDGKVHLPVTVSKAALMEELVYYGFEDVDESSVDDGRAQGALAITAHNDAYDTLRKVFNEAHIDVINGDCSYVAVWMIERYLEAVAGGSSKTHFSVKDNDDKWKEIYPRVHRIQEDAKYVEKINFVLNKAGLAMPNKFFGMSRSGYYKYNLVQTIEQKAESN